MQYTEESKKEAAKAASAYLDEYIQTCVDTACEPDMDAALPAAIERSLGLLQPQPELPLQVGTINRGHGHVVSRPDGVKAKCGGPAMCKDCAGIQARTLRLRAEAATQQRNALLALMQLLVPGRVQAVGLTRALDEARHDAMVTQELMESAARDFGLAPHLVPFDKDENGNDICRWQLVVCENSPLADAADALLSARSHIGAERPDDEDDGDWWDRLTRLSAALAHIPGDPTVANGDD